MGSTGLQYSVSPLLMLAVASITMCPALALIRQLLAARLTWGLSSTTTRPVASTIASSPSDLFPQSDRKSTRLNSSHSQISYAVFCLKKKNMAPGGHLWRDVLKSPRAAGARGEDRAAQPPLEPLPGLVSCTAPPLRGLGARPPLLPGSGGRSARRVGWGGCPVGARPARGSHDRAVIRRRGPVAEGLLHAQARAKEDGGQRQYRLQVFFLNDPPPPELYPLPPHGPLPI